MVPAGILRPSNAARWSKCAGSFVMEALYPDDESEAARQGTAAHWYVSEALDGREWPAGTVTPNGVPLDDEMVECGQLYLDHVRALQRGGAAVMVEWKVYAHETIHPECEGTPDGVVVDMAAHRIVIVDYKYGHRYVDPFQNAQLVVYFAGVCEAAALSRQDTKGWDVELTVVQPRNYHPDGPVRTWKTLGHVVWAEVDKLQEAAYRAKEPNAPTITGAHCRDCTAIHACEAALRVGSYAIDMPGRSIPQELPDTALGVVLTQIDAGIARLEALQTGLVAQAQARIRAGGKVPGWGLTQGMGREKWTLPAEQVIALGDVLGVPLAKPATITPAQARKLLDPAIVDELATTPYGEFKLKPSNDKTAAKAFG